MFSQHEEVTFESGQMNSSPPWPLPVIEELNEEDYEERSSHLPYIEYLGESSSKCQFSNTTNMDGSIPESFTVIPDGCPFTIGRENSSWIIKDLRVSKSHFKIYTIVYDKDKKDILPMLYCEDLESSNGTFVNGVLIGNEHTAEYSGKIPYLLTDGDIIEIKPDWKFKIHQPAYEGNQGQCIKPSDQQRMLPDYTISNRVLGTGNYGSVYLAREVKDLRQVACKVIDLAKSVQESLFEDSPTPKTGRRRRLDLENEKLKFKKEIDILAALSHPHIINLRKAFYSNDTIYIFTDLATGGDLYSYFDSHERALSDENARVIALQVAHAIEYLHSMNIVHRDIKPENVLLSNADFGSRVVLTDFGFAKYVNNSTGRLLSRVGTHGFIAPEIDLQEDMAPNGYTKAADLWSFGMLVAFMLTGEQRIADNLKLHLDLDNAVSRFLARVKSRTSVKRRAYNFIENLLVVDADKRLTAEQALTHMWFTEPALAAAELSRGWERVNRTWKKRSSDAVMIVDLQPRKQSAVHGARSLSKRQKTPHDASSFPYNGLDRHLQPKKTSKRKQVLEELHGSSFITDDLTQGLRSIQFSNHKRKRSSLVLQVDGRDMFNQAPAISESQCTTQDLSPEMKNDVNMGWAEEEVLIPAENDSVGEFTTLDATSDTDTSLKGPTRSQYFRTASIDQSLHDTALESLPKWTTAKSLKEMKDEVARQKFDSPKMKSLVM